MATVKRLTDLPATPGLAQTDELHSSKSGIDYKATVAEAAIAVIQNSDVGFGDGLISGDLTLTTVTHQSKIYRFDSTAAERNFTLPFAGGGTRNGAEIFVVNAIGSNRVVITYRSGVSRNLFPGELMGFRFDGVRWSISLDTIKTGVPTRGYLDLNVAFVSVSSIKVLAGSTIEVNGRSQTVPTDVTLTAADLLGRTDTLPLDAQLHIAVRENPLTGALQFKLILGHGDSVAVGMSIVSITQAASVSTIVLSGTGHGMAVGNIAYCYGTAANNGGFVIGSVSEGGGNTTITWTNNNGATAGSVGNVSAYHKASNLSTAGNIIYSPTSTYNATLNGYYSDHVTYADYRLLAEFTTETSVAGIRIDDIMAYHSGRKQMNTFFRSTNGTTNVLTATGSYNVGTILSAATRIKGSKISVASVGSVLRVTALESVWLDVSCEFETLQIPATGYRTFQRIITNTGTLIHGEVLSDNRTVSSSAWGKGDAAKVTIYLATGDYIYFTVVVSVGPVDTAMERLIVREVA